MGCGNTPCSNCTCNTCQGGCNACQAPCNTRQDHCTLNKQSAAQNGMSFTWANCDAQNQLIHECWTAAEWIRLQNLIRQFFNLGANVPGYSFPVQGGTGPGGQTGNTAAGGAPTFTTPVSMGTPLPAGQTNPANSLVTANIYNEIVNQIARLGTGSGASTVSGNQNGDGDVIMSHHATDLEALFLSWRLPNTVCDRCISGCDASCNACDVICNICQGCVTCITCDSCQTCEYGPSCYYGPDCYD